MFVGIHRKVGQVHIPHPGGQQELLLSLMLGNTEIEFRNPRLERPEAATVALNGRSKVPSWLNREED